MKKYVFILLLILCNKLFAGDCTYNGIPLIKNYTTFYEDAHRQNWDIIQSPNGLMYFANTRGLLEFDGKDWFLYRTQKITGLRATKIDSTGRVFIGAANEFGYFEPDKFGKMKYESLSEKFLINCGVIWNVVLFKGSVYFISYQNHIYKYDGNTVTELTVPPTFKKFKGFVCNDNLYFFDDYAGLAILQNDTILRFHDEIFSKERRIYSILPLNQTEMVLITRYSGIFKLNYKNLKPLSFNKSHSLKSKKADISEITDGKGSPIYHFMNTEISVELKKHEPYNAIKMINGNFAVATLKGGVFIADNEGNIIENYSEDIGLLHNTIFQVFEDNEQNLWISGEKGISIVSLHDGFRVYNENTNIKGTISRALITNEYIYIGTSVGLYVIEKFSSFSGRHKKHTPLTQEDIYNTNIYEFKDNSRKKIIFNSTRGSKIYDPVTKEVTKIPFKIITHSVVTYPYDNSILLYSHNQGIDFVRKKPGKNWDNIETVANILTDYHDIQMMDFDSDGKLFITNDFAGLTVLTFPQPNNFEDYNYTVYGQIHGLPVKEKNSWAFIGDTIFICTQNGIYTVDNKENIGKNNLNFIPVTEINNELAKYHLRVECIKKYKNNLLIGTYKGLYLFDLQTKTIRENFFGRLKNEYIREIYIAPDGCLWITTQLAVYHFNENQLFTADKKPQLYIKNLNFGNDTLMQINFPKNNRYNAGTVSFQNNSISVNVSMSGFINSDYLLYSFYLEGFDKSWITSDNNRYSQTYLPSGKYTLNAKVINEQGIESDTVKIHFTVMSPWYLSWYAWLIYSLTGILLIYFILKLLTLKYFRDKQNLTIAINNAVDTVSHQLEEILLQKEEILQQKIELTDSIEYAKQIQQAIFLSNSYITKLFPSSFVINIPRDIVSGDFLWCHQNDRYKVIVVADCTGHGVPGAFMSIIAANFLKEIIITKSVFMPHEILNLLRYEIITALNQSENENSHKDGLDASIVTIDTLEHKMYFSGAINPIYVLNKGVLTKFNADKMPIGIYIHHSPFTLTTIPLSEVENVYMLSDGYIDQFGKITGHKLSSKRFANILVSIQHLDMMQQKDFLKAFLDNWKRDTLQIDDIIVIGFNPHETSTNFSEYSYAVIDEITIL